MALLSPDFKTSDGNTCDTHYMTPALLWLERPRREKKEDDVGSFCQPEVKRNGHKEGTRIGSDRSTFRGLM